MKWLLCATLLGVLFMGEGEFLQNDPIDATRINVKSSTGALQGWLKRDMLLFPNRFNVYDKEGRRKGYFEKDTLCPDRMRFRKE